MPETEWRETEAGALWAAEGTKGAKGREKIKTQKNDSSPKSLSRHFVSFVVKIAVCLFPVSMWELLLKRRATEGNRSSTSGCFYGKSWKRGNYFVVSKSHFDITK